VVLRIVSGILAVTLLPLAIVFVVIGLTADEIDRGEPQTFAYVGALLALAGLAFAIVFVVLQRREAARRRRRRSGLRTRAEVVRADLNHSVRVNGRPALRLTVRVPGAEPVEGTFLSDGRTDPAPGDWIEITYDPAEPSNFEPLRT
jgi:hypothetical protein